MEELTIEQLKAMKDEEIFATGTAMDKAGELFMANTGKELRWVAVRGSYHDWAIYCHFSNKDTEWIQRFGDKVCDKVHIKSLVSCTDEAFKMYSF